MIDKIMDKIFILRDLSEIQDSTGKKILLLVLFYILVFIMFPFDVYGRDKAEFAGIMLSWCSVLSGLYVLIYG